MNLNEIIDLTVKEEKKWVGYLEKSAYSYVKNATYDNPEDFTKGAGENNYTVFANTYKQMCGDNLQGGAWCLMFQMAVMYHMCGYNSALLKKVVGGISAYTPTSVNYFKQIGRWSNVPQVGAWVFFKNSQRVCHVEFVYHVDSTMIYTVGGNTSNGTKVIPNGGSVCLKSYYIWNTAIAGYGMPMYELLVTPDPVEPKKEYYEGWIWSTDKKKWWYQTKDGNWYCDNGKNHGWYKINGFWYLFDKEGWMLTGFQENYGNKYYLYEGEGSDMGKCMVSDAEGKLTFLKA